MAKIYKHNILVEGALPLDSKYYNVDVPYISTTQANALIPTTSRYEGLTVNVAGTEYWYSGGTANINLVIKTVFITFQQALINGSLLTQNNTVDVADYNFTFNNVGIFGINVNDGGVNINVSSGETTFTNTSGNFVVNVTDGEINLNSVNGIIEIYTTVGGLSKLLLHEDFIDSYAGLGFRYNKTGTAYFTKISIDNITTDRQNYMPNADGTFTVSVNGILADDNGNISVPVIAASNTITRETPSGTINGINDTFTLAYTPVPGTEHVYVNGVLQDEGAGNDYTISTNTITFLSGAIPQTTDKLRVSYIK